MTHQRRIMRIMSLGLALCLQFALHAAIPLIPLIPMGPEVAPAQPTPEQALPPLTTNLPVLQSPLGQAGSNQLSGPSTLPTIALPPIPGPNPTPTQNLLALNGPALTPAPNNTQPVTSPSTSPALSQAPEKRDIYLNFENTDLATFVEYIRDLKKINILTDKAIDGSKISLTIREPLSVDGAWNIFLSVLEISGFSIVQTGLIYKIVAKDKKAQQPLPAYINVPYNTLPENDLTIRYVFFLSNIQVKDIQPVLESMLGAGGIVIPYETMNAFIVVDKALNIRSIAKLLQELDQMGLPESMTVMRLKRINAVDAKTLIESLVPKTDNSPSAALARILGKSAEGSVSYFAATTRVIAEERTNSLILLGNNKSIQKIVDFISNNIDTEIKAAASPLHIYELQNVDAQKVMEVLKEVTAAPDSATGKAASQYGSIRGGVKYFKSGIQYQVDKDGNRLIVSCTDKQDWEIIKQTIQDLDKPQPQVGLESLIVSIDSDDYKNLGGGIRNKIPGNLGKNINFQASNQLSAPAFGGDSTPVNLLGNLLSKVGSDLGSTILTFGSKENLWGVLQAVKTLANTSIFSQPFVTVANKTEASITVGTTARIPSATSTQPNAGSTLQTTSYDDAKANTTLTITPQINLDGIIRLKIKVDIVDFIDNNATKTQTKTLNTDVTVADGQVLVLGGFVKTKVAENKDETPILSKIPILGWFFKQQNRRITKQYIFVFISPSIIKPRQTPGMQLYTKMKLHQATSDIEQAVDTKHVMDPVHNWFFNAEKENYSHKVIDFANARYQPTTVDIKFDPYYRSNSEKHGLLAAAQTPITSAIPIQTPVVQAQPVLPQPAPTPIAAPAPVLPQPTPTPILAPVIQAPAQVPTPTPVPAPTPIPALAVQAPALPVQTQVPVLPEPPLLPLPAQPAPVVQQALPAPVTLGAVTDDVLEAQRARLRQLLTTPDNPQQPQQQLLNTAPFSTPQLPLEQFKRNNLKEFLKGASV